MATHIFFIILSIAILTTSAVHPDFPDWLDETDYLLLHQNMPKPDLIVAKDGTGDYQTVTDAVAAIGTMNRTRTVIFIKEGVYQENVYVNKDIWNVMMYGEGMRKTIISGHLSVTKDNIQHTYLTATFRVDGQRFMAKDMGFQNTAGPEGGQAVALVSTSDASVFYWCSFDAYQDTLYARRNRQFYRNCDIRGTIDFIFGNAMVIFKECVIQPKQPLPQQYNTITAQGKDSITEESWTLILNCSITPLDDVTADTYLGRPWGNYSTTIIMDTYIGDTVNPLGWVAWRPDISKVPEDTVFFGEYRNLGPGSDLTNRVHWTSYHPSLPDEIAIRYKCMWGCLE